MITRKTKLLPVARPYKKLLTDIGIAIERAKHNASVAINHELVRANWEIGQHIVQFEQKGNERAEYGSALLERLSKDLRTKFGKGFSKSSVYLSRELYLSYPIFQTLSGKLSWSHYVILLGISDRDARKFYVAQIEHANWSVREFARQLNSSLYERFALSKNKRAALQHRVKNKKRAGARHHEAVKDPYVLDFLGINGKGRVSERLLEQRLIDNMQSFLLELGKGFAFVARQFKISIGSNHFYVDLVFYHRILKCFVLFELKTRPVKHTDIGQMNLYINYFKAEENVRGDNEPIGVILSADKNEILVKYAMGSLSNKIFVSKYQLHLPLKKDLQRQLKEFVEIKNTSP